jgi:histidinol-phosphate aminotransferase
MEARRTMTTGCSGSVTHRPTLEMICPYEPGKPIEEVQRELGLLQVTKLASNENPLGPSPQVTETLNRTNLGLHLYPDYEGYYLRQALAAKLGVAAEQVLLGAGSAELMRLVADAFLEQGDEGIVADICFPVYANVIRIAGATPVTVPLDAELGYDLQRMLSAVTPRTRVLFVATPNNPTGRFTSLGDVATLLERLPSHVLCVLDLAYWEYVQGAQEGALRKLLQQHENLVLLRTFSKAYGLAGLRIGYAVASEAKIGWLRRVRIPFNTSSAAQLAARVGLEDTQHLLRTVELNGQMLRLLDRELRSMGMQPWPSQANFVLADTGRDSDAVFDCLLRKGMIIRPVRHPRLRTCIRITTGTEDQMQRLFAVMREELTGR